MEDEDGSQAMTAVQTRMTGGPEITAAITSDAAADLKLEAGSVVRGERGGRAGRPGQYPQPHPRHRGVSRSRRGDDRCEDRDVGRWCPDVGHHGESAADLHLAVGMSVTGLVKSTDLAIAVD